MIPSRTDWQVRSASDVLVASPTEVLFKFALKAFSFSRKGAPLPMQGSAQDRSRWNTY